jgi:hypothetical protein
MEGYSMFESTSLLFPNSAKNERAGVTDKRIGDDQIAKIDEEIAKLEEEVIKIKGTETEVYTRITGFHQPLTQWNKGKREEYKERIKFSTPDYGTMTGRMERFGGL